MKTQRIDPRQDMDDWLEHLDKWGFFIVANLLWVGFSLPIVTMPAATAGLFAVMMKRARGQQPELFAEFFGMMRQCARQATILMLLNAGVAGLVILNLNILPKMPAGDLIAYLAQSVTLFVGALVILVNLYVWPLLVLVEMPLKLRLTRALQLVFAYPVWSLGLALLALLPVGISLLLPQAVWVLGTISAVAYIVCRGAWRVLHKHFRDIQTPE